MLCLPEKLLIEVKIKDKSSYRFTSFDWNDEVIVVSINNTKNLFDENNNLLQNKLFVTEPNKFSLLQNIKKLFGAENKIMQRPLFCYGEF